MLSRGPTLVVALLALGSGCGASPPLTKQASAGGGGDAAMIAAGGSMAGNTGGAGTSGGAANGGAETPASTWITDLTTAYCTWAVRCGRGFFDAASCNAFMRPQLAVVNFNTPSAAVTAVSKGTAQFDQTQAMSCLAAVASFDCDSPPPLGLALIPTPCAAVFSGSVVDGGACIDDVECPSGSMCVIASTETCEGTCMPASNGRCRTNEDCDAQGACEAVQFAGSGVWGSGVCDTIVPPGTVEGAPCGTPVQCAPGLTCAGVVAPIRCYATGTATLGAGATCGVLLGEGPFCGPGLTCIPSDDGSKSTCMPPAKLGDPCTALLQCGVDYEVRDSVCDETGTHTCVHRPSTGPCKIVNNEDTCDALTSYCDAASGTCRPRLPPGSACVSNPNGIDPCAIWSLCQGSVCAPLLVGACTPK